MEVKELYMILKGFIFIHGFIPEQIRSIIAIGMILQSSQRIQPVSPYFAFKTINVVLEAAFIYIQVSDAWM